MRHHFLHCALFLAAVTPAIWAAASDASDGLLRRTLAAELAAPDAVDLSAHWLQAGPIRVKLQEGQLRYITVGNKEIIRRIYFAVRDGTWATASPKYTLMKIDSAADHFTVQMAAECKMGPVDYSWSGTITGTAEGKITFHAQGTPNASFNSNRIGLCVLYGTPSLAKQEFTTDGTPASGTFPVLVSAKHVADQFHKLQYTTADGLAVACSVQDAIFDMEDQRNWGDSSWKAFAPMAYKYPKIAQGDVKGETVTLAVSGKVLPNSPRAAEGQVQITIGQPIPGSTLPALSAADPSTSIPTFTPISFKRDTLKNAARVEWSYIPTTHLPDDDMIMENVPAVADQANTVIGFSAVKPELHVGPIGLDAKGLDPRANSPLGAAFVVGMANSLALGHVPAGSFDLKGEWPAAALEALKPYAGWQMLDVQTPPEFATDLMAFGCVNGAQRVVFLVNRSPEPLRPHLLVGREQHAISALQLAPGAAEQPLPDQPMLLPPLQPHGVCRVTLAATPSPK